MDDFDDLLGLAPTRGRTIAYTVFASTDTTVPQPRRGTMSDIETFVRATTIRPEGKLKGKQGGRYAGPLVKLASFNEHGRDAGRGAILSVDGVELDHDAGQITAEEAEELLREAGVEALVFTTRNAPNWRAFAALSEPSTPAARRELSRRLAARVFPGVTFDPASFGDGCFFVGAVAGEPRHIVLVEGEPFDTVLEPMVERAAATADDDDDRELVRIMDDAKDRESFNEDYVSGELDRALSSIPDDALDRATVIRIMFALHLAGEGDDRAFALYKKHADRSPWRTDTTRPRDQSGAHLSEASLLRKQKRTWSRVRHRGDNLTRLGSIYGMAQECGWSRHSAAIAALDSELEDLPDYDALLGPPAIRETASGDDDDLLGPIGRPEQVDPGVNPNTEWKSSLALGEDGEIKATLHNVGLIAANDTRIYGRLGFNLLLQSKVFVRPPAPLRKKARDGKAVVQMTGPIWDLDEPGHAINGKRWTDDHDNALRAVIEAPRGQGGYGLKVSDRDLRAAIGNVANQHIFHPIRDRLRSFTWDGTPRAERLFVDYLETPDEPYYRETARLMLLGAVARVFSPGHKFDFMVILEGAQGAGKSTFIRTLGLDWSAEFTADFHDSNAIIEALQGAWVLEVPELQGFSKADTTILKAVVSRTHDKGRLAYERNVREFPRQCIFIGSTNEDDYLRDATGGRRFWPIKVSALAINTARLAREVEQIWAEALTWFDDLRRTQPRGDLPLYLRNDAAAAAAREMQESRRTETPEEMLAAQIRQLLDEPVSTDLDGTSEGRLVTCLNEVWVDLLGNDRRELSGNQINTRMLAKAMRLAGWVQGGTMRHPKYGVPKAWRKAP